MSKQHKVGTKVYLFLLGVAIAGITFYMYNGFHSSIRIYEQTLNRQETNYQLSQNKKLINQFDEESAVKDTNSIDNLIEKQVQYNNCKAFSYTLKSNRRIEDDKIISKSTGGKKGYSTKSNYRIFVKNYRFSHFLYR